MPDSPPRTPGLEFLGWSQPSREVGGDFYDYIELGAGRVAVVLGDATGKGLTAALLSTQCSSILRTLAIQDVSPAELLRQTNEEFYKRVGSTHRFVTLFLMVFDPASERATFASAGHPPPILVNPRRGTSEWLRCEGGFPLGIVKGATYGENAIELHPSDTIVIFSDGLTDAQNRNNELYGEDRIAQILERTSADTNANVLDELRGDAERHMDGKEPTDDMTIVIARFDPLVGAEVSKAERAG